MSRTQSTFLVLSGDSRFVAAFHSMLRGFEEPFMLPQNTSNTIELVSLRTGKVYVEKWMQEKCHLIRLPEDKDYNGVLPQFMTYTEQFRGIPGEV